MMTQGPARDGSESASRRAVVLLSGGLDSTTTLAMARAEGFTVYALTIDYGQRHCFELESARAVAEAYQVAEHRVLSVDLGSLGGSALTDEIAVPMARDAAAMADGIPITYVPARNTLMLALALGMAKSRHRGPVRRCQCRRLQRLPRLPPRVRCGV